MNKDNRKAHWENIYETKPLESVSWYQPNPETSLQFVRDLTIPKNAKIIDVGGGDSFFVDHLLDLGFEDITVLDISLAAIERARKRLKHKADNITWIVTDITTFTPTEQYDFWHDRAAFHFLTDEQDIQTYIQTANQALSTKGNMVLGTFSNQGPLKCSGIEVKQYTEVTLADAFQRYFQKTNGFTIDHKTPFDTQQNFVFCSFKKNNKAVS